jgi:hypothetical protein
MVPPGWKPWQYSASQPPVQYPDFRAERHRELGRPFGMPLLMVRLDSSKHNYSSARLDTQTYNRTVSGIQCWLSGTTNSTVAQIKAAINAHAKAKLFVVVTATATGVPTTNVSTTSLTGGVNPVTKSTPAQVAAALNALDAFTGWSGSATYTATTTTKTLGPVASGSFTGGVNKESATARATAMTLAKALNTTSETAVFWVPAGARRDFTLGEGLIDIKITAATAGQAAVFVEVAYESER